MKRPLLIAAAVVGLALAAPASAADLRGQWHISVPSRDGYLGGILIDAQRRATWDAALENRPPVKLIGYVKADWAEEVEMTFTNRAVIVHVTCTKESSDILRCVAIDDGIKTAPFLLLRVGPAPASLIDRHSRPR